MVLAMAVIIVYGWIVFFTEWASSTLVSTGIYIFPRQVFDMIREYLGGSGGRDRLGDFIQWLYKKTPVYGYVLDRDW